MSDMSISPILLSAKEAKRPYALARSSLDTAMQVGRLDGVSEKLLRSYTVQTHWSLAC